MYNPCIPFNLRWANALWHIPAKFEKYVYNTVLLAHHDNDVAHVFGIFRVEEVHKLFLAESTICVFVRLLPTPAVSVDHVTVGLCSGSFHIRI